MENKYNETILLLKYMIKHNESHTTELKELFSRIEEIDNSSNDLFNEAISDYQNGTEKLKIVLRKLEEKKDK